MSSGYRELPRGVRDYLNTDLAIPRRQSRRTSTCLRKLLQLWVEKCLSREQLSAKIHRSKVC